MFRVGNGPDEFSSVTWLAIRPQISFDVNGYYRALGVHWQATRGELREAYLAKNGPESAYLTYVFRQLLDPEVRRQYDLMPMGEIFRDKYEEQKLKRKIQEAIWEENRRRLEEGIVQLDEATLWNDLRAQTSSKPLARTPVARYVSSQPRWPYSYYIKDVGPDDERAIQWQRALIRELSKNGLWLRLSVGIQSSSSGVYALGAENGRCVFFIGHLAEIDDTAAMVAVDLKNHFQFLSN